MVVVVEGEKARESEREREREREGWGRSGGGRCIRTVHTSHPGMYA